MQRKKPAAGDRAASELGGGSSIRWILWGLFLLLSVGMEARAQTATVSGFVTDASTGQPLELVNVLLQEIGGDETLRGAATDPDGLYLLPRLAPGRYALAASFIGYEPFRDTLTLDPGEVRTVNIALSPDEEALGEVVVETERTSGAARVTAGQQTIRPEEVTLVPTPDVSGDLASYLTTLPGVVSTADRGGQLFVRGGEPSQNLVLLDGITLYQPFHLLGFYSAFPSEVLSRADVYAGGFGARYGGRLSSVIDVATATGNNRRFTGSLALSPFLSGVHLEGPVVPGRFSFLASARRSTLEQGASLYVGEELPFTFGDFFAKVQGPISSNSRASFTTLHTYDRGTLGRQEEEQATGSVPPEEIRYQNRGYGLRYLILPRLLPVTANVRISHSGLDSELGPEATPTRSASVRHTELAIDATLFGRRTTADAGFSVQLVTLDSELGGLYQNIESRNTKMDLVSWYVEPEFPLGGGLRIRPGVRLQFLASRFEPVVEPRLRVVWEGGLHQVSGAAGLYHQEVVGLSDRRDAASIFTAWSIIPPVDRQDDVRAGRIPRAVHGILGYRVTPTDALELSLEGYYKYLQHLFIAEWTALPQFTTRLQPADGRSFGFDVRAELRRPRLWPALYGYVNYGFSSTRYEAEQAALEVWYGVERLSFRPAHDRRHQVNALLSTTLQGFDLSVRWQFGSGLPFSRALGFDGFVLIDDLENAAELPSTRRVIYERPYEGILPTYHRLDVSAERTFLLGAAALTLQASAINVYDRRNLLYLDVFTLRRADQLPFVPSLGIKVAFE